MQIDYYYSLMSPRAYFGAPRLYELQKKYGFIINHFLLDILKLFSLFGGKLLAERADQRKSYRIMELKRWKKKLNLPINFILKFFSPSDVCMASSMILSIQDSKIKNDLSIDLLKCVWVEEKNIGDKKTLIEVCEVLNLKSKKILKQAEANKKLYHSLDDETANRNVFSSPSYVLNKEVFLGSRSIRFIRRSNIKK